MLITYKTKEKVNVKKILLIIALGLLAGCQTMTGITVHSTDVYALKEYGDNKCDIAMKGEKTIHSSFACNEVKFFGENSISEAAITKSQHQAKINEDKRYY